MITTGRRKYTRSRICNTCRGTSRSHIQAHPRSLGCLHHRNLHLQQRPQQGARPRYCTLPPACSLGGGSCRRSW
ncbi:Os03g0738101 [Oryza sativa Japonica Group]|uniref:Os03g0738101 protein n=1 Tax=Oryza sativa subsp. japonica TaxID=39947 RepID=A0A0P0W368_ORYSJ|nr:hypothetical protein EE612_020321 [Oryza sativa]BAS86285.1 Os03g0738101 [Oryza sativa Japonica Group]